MENFGGTKGIQLRPMKSQHFKLSCGMVERVSQRVDCKENELARRKECKTNAALQVSQNVAWRKEGEKEKEQWQSNTPKTDS